LGIEDDVFCPAPEKPAAPQCRTTAKTPTPPARQHPTKTSPNQPKPLATTDKTNNQASHKKLAAAPQGRQQRN